MEGSEQDQCGDREFGSDLIFCMSAFKACFWRSLSAGLAASFCSGAKASAGRGVDTTRKTSSRAKRSETCAASNAFRASTISLVSPGRLPTAPPASVFEQPENPLMAIRMTPQKNRQKAWRLLKPDIGLKGLSKRVGRRLGRRPTLSLLNQGASRKNTDF